MEKDLYQEMYEMEMTHWWFRARRHIILKILREYINPSSTPRFLDIGCGTGAMLRELEKLGEAVGVDVSEDAISFARSRTGARLIKGEVPEDLYSIEDRFDFVLMLDILEHIDDDLDALNAASTLLKADGLLLATVPSYQWLYAPRDLYHHHRRRYTKKSLQRMITGAGLEVLFISYFNFFLFPIAAVQRRLSRFRKRQNTTDLRLPPAPVNHALEMIFGAEGYLLPHVCLPWGLSIISLSRRVID